ncbi:MAG TPA: hypothetical protein VMM15_31750 [Bradyrhizobium sp.]|nr:hypothetical protein [Bradyrhizobium sp.]
MMICHFIAVSIQRAVQAARRRMREILAEMFARTSNVMPAGLPIEDAAGGSTARRLLCVIFREAACVAN